MAGELIAASNDLIGHGTITVSKGGILDADFLFDTGHGTMQSLAFGSGGTLSFNLNGGVLGVGHKGRGSLTIVEGVNVTSSNGSLAFSAGSTGTGLVSGVGSKWTNTSALYVGSAGSGTLTINAGGQVSDVAGYLANAAGSMGSVIVTGAGSKWTNTGTLFVGREGSGTLTIEAGGQVSNALGRMALLAGSTGSATVTGPGSKWTNSSELFVGTAGNGVLTVEAGGQVSNTGGYVGYNSSSTSTVRTVTGAGSKWTNSGALNVGDSGAGSLVIENGGQVSNTYGYLGTKPARQARQSCEGQLRYGRIAVRFISATRGMDRLPSSREVR